MIFTPSLPFGAWLPAFCKIFSQTQEKKFSACTSVLYRMQGFLRIWGSTQMKIFIFACRCTVQSWAYRKHNRKPPYPCLCLCSTEVKQRGVLDWTGQTTAQFPNKKTWQARSQWRIRATKADDGYAKHPKQAPGLALTAAFFSNIFTFSAQMEIQIWHRGGKQALLEKNTADWALVSSDYRFYISAMRKRERLA